MLRCMPNAQRKTLGKAGLLPNEISEKQALKLEKELHNLCLNYLRQKNVFVIHSRMDRKTTNQTGIPDLIFALPSSPHGIPCAVELKRSGCHPTPEQVKVLEQLDASGWTTRVVTTFEQFQIFLRNQGA